MIIGLTGTLGAGKGNLVEKLKEQGFEHFSVRRFLQEKGAKDRDEMVALANELRVEHGANYIAEQLYEQAQQSGNSVIESLRNPAEIQALRNKGGFYLIGVDAPIKDRYNRIQKRASATDNISFDEFKSQEQRELNSTDPNTQNLSKCLETADYFFWSDFETPEHAQLEFEKGKTGFLNLFKNPKRRPTFSEEFMRQAWEWSYRTTCLRRRTGAVIINPEDNTFISQGYNGSPRGVKHCEDRGGCVRQKQGIASGENLELCYAAHAEANAIWNAGRIGRPVIGATMYATTYPCKDCSNAIIQSGISKVVYFKGYPTELSERILEEAGIEMQRFRQGVSPQAFSKIWG